ncbi:MAG: hypothetical protein KF870_06105 [Leadbetterella sp.]|nr:hypothetical protein [Leadbetterella sp.]
MEIFFKLLPALVLTGTLMALTTDQPVKGKYRWDFEIPGSGVQTSVHDFSDTHILYTMKGSAYTVEYRMDIVKHEKNRYTLKGAEGSPKSGRYFVIFLKDITPDAITMYKKEFATLEEALAFPEPDSGNTESHGWNVYSRVKP